MFQYKQVPYLISAMNEHGEEGWRVVADMLGTGVDSGELYVLMEREIAGYKAIENDEQINYDIVVNTIHYELALDDGYITYEQICNLANQPVGATVLFRDGADYREGILHTTNRTRVKDGTIFDCVVTNRA